MKTRKDTCVWMIHQKNNLWNGCFHIPGTEVAFCHYLFALQKLQLKVPLPVTRQDTNLGLGMSVLNQNCSQLAVHGIFPSHLPMFSIEELKTRFTDSKMEKVNSSFCPQKHLETKTKCRVHPHLCTVLSALRHPASHTVPEALMGTYTMRKDVQGLSLSGTQVHQANFFFFFFWMCSKLIEERSEFHIEIVWIQREHGLQLSVRHS